MAHGDGSTSDSELPPPSDPWGVPATPPTPNSPAKGPLRPVAGSWTPPVAATPAYNQGRAQVGARRPAPLTVTQEYPAELRGHAEAVLGGSSGVSWEERKRQLRRGREWSWIGGLIGLVGWGLWAVSSIDSTADLGVPVLALVLVIAIAAGVFALARLVGRVVLERTMGRARRSAWGAHLTAGVFCALAGFAYLAQTPWIVSAWNFVRGV
ncbi:hypothetical protein GCM10010201_32640 [Pilimelia columellifera subsp. columellifera]|uniref:Uncharacterized protein n=2 Tax=Pilimelia TaxID=53370 RepID=A0ABN3NRV7_9ACTN